ncbi:unnamed protein product [Mytilus coruscus]|uniref:Immunoglobulin subtype domain-containing protein n=1 Tax=Mytilus coruscus TaxID=42192 RepID=A0A6J8BKP2_MYTCO|nr:unnamed protein product [Mytilus coruscus]
MANGLVQITYHSRRLTIICHTHGTYLNPSLNKSKYKVLGGYEETKCYLRITNFLSEDDGTYMCQYFSSSTIYIDVYKIVATRSTYDQNRSTDNDMMYTDGVIPITEYVGDKSSVNYDGTNTKTETYTFETKRIVSEIPLEVQYYEIGSIIDNIASIHDVRNNLEESLHSVDGAAPANTGSSIYSLEKGSSSESSVQSFSNPLLNVDEYENPYQMIDLENIQPHLYSTIGSNMYQNTIIFQKEIRNKQTEHTIQNVKERDPWLIIYK